MKKHVEIRNIPQEEARQTTMKSAAAPKKGGTVPVRAGKETTIPGLFNEMERYFDEFMHRPFAGMGLMPMRQLFHEFGTFGEHAPAVDIFEDENNVIVKAELAGMKRDEINVRLHENSIIISGEKKAEEKVERKDYFRLERTYGSFNRTLSLPDNIDVENARATFKDGLLEVRIPKSSREEAVRRVPVE